MDERGGTAIIGFPMVEKKSLERPSRALLLSAVLVLPLLLGCQQKSPAQEIEELRAGYDVRLNGFIVREAPVAAPLPAATPGEGATPAPLPAGEEATPAPTADAAVPPAPGEEGAMPAIEDVVVPSARDVVLDLLVHNGSAGSLPGITVDISQAGPDEAEKAHFRAFLDTSRIARGQSTQLSHMLEGVEFAPGDRFAVEVVSPVPAEQHAEYREFQAQ